MNLLLNQKRKKRKKDYKYFTQIFDNFFFIFYKTCMIHCLSSLHVHMHLYGMYCTITILKTRFTFNYEFD